MVRLDGEEIEGLLLDVGELGDNRKNALRLVFHMHVVEDDGGEIGKQGTEAVDGQSVGAALGGALMFGGVRRLRGFHRSLARRLRTVRVVVLKQHRRERSAHVPLDIEGEHAEEDMRTDPVFLVDVQGTDIEIGLGIAKGALHRREILIGCNCGMRRDCLRIEIGTNNIHTVEAGLGSDALLPALPGEGRIGDGDIKMLADRLAVDVASDGLVDGGGAFSMPGARARGDLVQGGLGCSEKVLAFAGPFLLQPWVEADHQPFPRKGIMRHLGDGIRDQFLRLQGRGMIIDRFEQLADIGGRQRRDPVDHRRREILLDAAGGDHAPVPHKSDLGKAETVPNLVHLCGQRRRVRRVAGEQLDRDRTAIRGAEKPVDDLFLALLAVAIVPELCEGTVTSFDITRRDVIEQQCLVVPQMPLCQGLLDPDLTFFEPIQHGENLVAGDVSEIQERSQAVRGGVRRQPAGHRQLRGRLQHLRHDRREG